MSKRPQSANSFRRSSLGLAKPLQLALVAMGGVLMVYAQAVAALGVGEPRYLSHLFEPLRVDIPVDSAGIGDDHPGVRLSVVAGNGEPAASDVVLDSEWLIDSSGHRILRVWTHRPVSEPVLNLRVEVDSAGARVQRDLSLLFDPAPIDIAPDSLPAARPAVPAVIAAIDSPPVAASPVESHAAAAVLPAAAVIAAIRADASTEASPITSPVTNPVTNPVVRHEAAQVRPAAAAGPQVTAATKPASPAVKAAAADPSASARAPAEAVSRAARIASTHAAPALSAADRWQRIPVAEGDTLEQLAARARGDHEVPLPVVAMLLRWLNPRSFDSAVGKPLPGAMLRFPKPESLAAQMAVSGDIWTPAATVEAGLPPVPSQVSAPASEAPQVPSDDALAVALASAGLLAAVPAPLSMPATLAGGPGNGARMSGGLTVGAMLVTVLTTILMLKMIAGTPTPIAQRYLSAQVLSRSETEAASGTARVLPAEAFTVALDLRGMGPRAADDPVELLRAHAAEREARRAARHPQA